MQRKVVISEILSRGAFAMFIVTLMCMPPAIKSMLKEISPQITDAGEYGTLATISIGMIIMPFLMLHGVFNVMIINEDGIVVYGAKHRMHRQQTRIGVRPGEDIYIKRLRISGKYESVYWIISTKPIADDFNIRHRQPDLMMCGLSNKFYDVLNENYKVHFEGEIYKG